MNLPFQALRQSAASLFAYALLELFPDAQLMQSEVSQIGFTYAFYLEQPLEEGVLELFEEKMRSLAKQSLPVTPIEMMRENAMSFFQHKGQRLKADIVAGSLYNIVQIVKIGESFCDYAQAPYVSSTQELTAFKLQKLERVKGEEYRFLLSGTIFPDVKQLKTFLKNFEMAKKRDHRLLGRDLSLYTFSDSTKKGWFWFPKGSFLREFLLDWWRDEHLAQGFQSVATPHNAVSIPVQDSHSRKERNANLAESSLESLHGFLFGLQSHVISDLPVRYFECATLFSNQASAFDGLFQSAPSTVERSTLFCSPSQVLGELISSLHFIEKTVNILGFECHWNLRPRGVKFAGTKENWDKVLGWMVEALQVCGSSYVIDSSGSGFEGPRMVVRMKDALGRDWDGPFIGVDFSSVKRFGLLYQEASGAMRTPYMITRSMFGSLERVIAVLVEHYSGVFPLWLAPEQVRLLPIGPGQHDYADAVRKSLSEACIRCYVDYRQESLGAKVHAAEREKIPYTVVLGDIEKKNGVVNVRSYNEQGRTKKMKVAEFVQSLQDEVSVPGLQSAALKKLLRGVEKRVESQ